MTHKTVSCTMLEAFLGCSKVVQDIKRLTARVGPTSSRVLITGENGVGKELIAQALHTISPRRNNTFVAINCAAIPRDLIESELFGHEKGAFTGASRTRQGKFEQAHGGTLFLDEIGDMPIELQSKLLRVLQTCEIVPVGSTIVHAVDVRIISATNTNLRQAIGSGKFREDLYHRLNVVHLHIPPLRERPEDIKVLINQLLPKHFNLTKAALTMLSKHTFPGNVRELVNIVERISVLADNNKITSRDLRLLVPDLEMTMTDQIEQSSRKGPLSNQHLLRRWLKSGGVVELRGGRTARVTDRRDSTLFIVFDDGDDGVVELTKDVRVLNTGR